MSYSNATEKVTTLELRNLKQPGGLSLKCLYETNLVNLDSDRRAAYVPEKIKLKLCNLFFSVALLYDIIRVKIFFTNSKCKYTSALTVEKLI